MSRVFISYASEDADFSQLCKAELEKSGFDVWLDHDGISPGTGWSAVIDDAIRSSDGLLVVLTPASCDSDYVIYEWAFALGCGIKVVPILLDECKPHPKLEALQHLDFSHFKLRPWGKLIETLQNPEAPKSPTETRKAGSFVMDEAAYEIAGNQVIDYLKLKGLTMISYDGIREYIDPRYSDNFLVELIRRRSDCLALAKLSGNRPGIQQKR